MAAHPDHADELQALLDKFAYRKGVDLLLCVGDLVNKGPDSEKVGGGFWRCGPSPHRLPLTLDYCLLPTGCCHCLPPGPFRRC